MKRFAIIFFVFLFLSFNVSTIRAITEPKTFTEGFYKVKDTDLLPNTNYKVKNNSPTGKSIVIIFDSNQQMQEFLRLEPNSPDYNIKPLNFDSIIVVIGNSVIFS